MIIDVPTAARAVQESEGVLSLVHDLRRAGNSVILIRHNLQHGLEPADRILVMHLGRVAGVVRCEHSMMDEVVQLIVCGSGDEAESEPVGSSE